MNLINDSNSSYSRLSPKEIHTGSTSPLKGLTSLKIYSSENKYQNIHFSSFFYSFCLKSCYLPRPFSRSRVRRFFFFFSFLCCIKSESDSSSFLVRVVIVVFETANDGRLSRHLSQDIVIWKCFPSFFVIVFAFILAVTGSFLQKTGWHN